jgi:hypothetical protein
MAGRIGAVEYAITYLRTLGFLVEVLPEASNYIRVVFGYNDSVLVEWYGGIYWIWCPNAHPAPMSRSYAIISIQDGGSIHRDVYSLGYVLRKTRDIIRLRLI